MSIPEITLVRQVRQQPTVADVAAETRKQWLNSKVARRIQKGDVIAVGCGSRGIANIAAIVRATVELAHNLGLTVIAVGVENDEQLEYLQLLGCDRAQGYYFAPPVPADQFADKVSAGFGSS